MGFCLPCMHSLHTAQPPAVSRTLVFETKAVVLSFFLPPLPPSLLSLSLTYFLPGPSPRGVRGNPDVLSVLEFIGMSSVLGKYVRAFLLSLEGLFR